MTPTLDALFGSPSASRVLLFLQNYGEGHTRWIATTFGLSPSQVYKQLVRLEDAGLLVSSLAGRTRTFRWNPRNPLVKSLREFLESCLVTLDAQTSERYFRERTRPRRAGKAL